MNNLYKALIGLVTVMVMLIAGATISDTTLESSGAANLLMASEDGDNGEEDAAEDAEEAIEDAHEEQAKADERIAEEEEEGSDVTAAVEIYNEAVELLAAAEAAFEEGNFEEAEELADEAKHTFMDAKSGSNFDSPEDEDEDEDEDNRTHPLPPAGFEDEVLTKMPNNPFADTDTDELEGLAAGELYRRGVLGGYPDGEFKGDREVNRAEASKFLLLARFEVVEETGEDVKFSDVIRGQWYVKYINAAAEKGIISGHPDGSFRPANTVNTAEFLKMLSLTFDLELDLPYSYTDVEADAWYAQYVGAAELYDLFPERTDEIMPADPLTRNEVAVAIYQYLANRDATVGGGEGEGEGEGEL